MCPSVSLICVVLMTLSAVTLQPGEAFTLPSPLVLRIGTASGSMARNRAICNSKHGAGGKRWKGGPELSRQTHNQFKRGAFVAGAAAGSVEETERTERDCGQATTCIVATRHEGLSLSLSICLCVSASVLLTSRCVSVMARFIFMPLNRCRVFSCTN
jgi:hypothetical protein